MKIIQIQVDSRDNIYALDGEGNLYIRTSEILNDLPEDEYGSREYWKLIPEEKRYVNKKLDNTVF